MLHRVLLEEKISYPINSPHFTKPEVSLFVHNSLQIVHILSQTHSVRTILQFTIKNSKWSLSFSFLYTKPACISLLLLTCQKTPPCHLIHCDLITLIFFQNYNICIFSSKLQYNHLFLCALPHSPATAPCYAQIPTLAYCLERLRIYSLNVRNQVLCPYKTTGKITVLDILILLFLVSIWVANISNI